MTRTQKPLYILIAMPWALSERAINFACLGLKAEGTNLRVMSWAATCTPGGQMQGGATQAMSVTSSRSANAADARAKPEPEGRMGVARRSLRCSSSTMCTDIASSSRLALAAQAPCARPLLILGQAPGDGSLNFVILLQKLPPPKTLSGDSTGTLVSLKRGCYFDGTQPSGQTFRRDQR